MCGLVVAKGLGKGFSSVCGKGGTGKEAPKGCPLLGGLNARDWGWGRSSQGLAIKKGA